MAFTHCGTEIKALMKVSDDDVRIIEEKLEERLALGEPRALAQRHAVADAIAMLGEERQLALDAVKKKIGEPKRVKNDVSFSVADKVPQTDTPAFKKWFGDSKVVDAQGNPKVMYHGTAKDFSAFDSNFLYSEEGASQTGSGFYFTDDPASASGYSGEVDGSNVMPVFLSLKKPLFIDFKKGETSGADFKFTKQQLKKMLMDMPNIRSTEDSPLLNYGDIEYEGFDKVLDRAISGYAGSNNIAGVRNDFFGKDDSWLKAFSKATGYDSAWTKTQTGATHYIAWFPEQIKSATGNIGTFDASNPDIRFSVGESKLVSAWKDFAKKGDVFNYKTSDAKTFEGVMRDVAPQFIIERNENAPDFKNAWEVFKRDANGKIDKENTAFISEFADGQIELNVLHWGEGADGAAVYAAVGNYAKNAGLLFTGDRNGISDTGRARRLENMISLALKHGGTSFIEPHPDMLKDMDWKTGDDAYNLDQMMKSSHRLITDINPDIKDIIYDASSKEFKRIPQADSKVSKKDFGDGKEVARGYDKNSDQRGTTLTEYELEHVANQTRSGGARVGLRTVKRAILSNTVLRGYELGQPSEKSSSVVVAPNVSKVLYNVADKTEYTPTNGTEPANAKQQALADLLARRINNGIGRDRDVPTVLHAVDARRDGNATLYRTTKAVTSFAKNIFGSNVVFVDFEGAPLFRGAMSDAISDTVFIDIKADKPHMAILGHELLHELRKTAPDIYERLVERLNQVLNPDALNKYSAELIAKYEAQGLKAPSNIDEELHGDIVGDNFNDPEFLQLLAKDQPAGFKKVLDSIAKFLDDVISKLTGANRPFGTDKYLTDIKAAREAVAIAMREFSGAQVGAVSMDKVTDDVNFAVAVKDSVPEETKWQGRQRVVQDKFNRFRVLQDWLKAKGINLSESADVYQAETLMSGRIASRKEDFRENQMLPLIKKTQKSKISMDDIGNYLKAQHAPEANKRARDIHNDESATAFGVTDKEAKDAIAEFEKQDNFQELKALANEWRDITSQTKQILLDGGILSKDMVAAWDATYSVYVPVKGSEESQGTGKGLSVNGKTKRRMGHGLRDEAIIENILRDHERAISLDEKNNVGKSLILFALEAKNDDIITIEQPEKRQIMRAGEVALQASPMLEENEVTVYLDGHAVRVQINDEIAARAYTNMGVEHLNTLLSGAREVNTWLSKAYTGYSPDFILTNPIRDAIQGSMTLTGEYGAMTAAKIFSSYPRAVKELIKNFKKNGSSQLVTDYRQHGGSTGAAYLSDLERIGNDLQASYDEYSGMMDTYKRAYQKAESEGKKSPRLYAAMRSGLAGVKKIPVIGHALNLMESINAVTENALRIATYDTLVKSGVSKGKAAAQAKNLMNFNRKGEVANTAGALYLFFNPSVQGSQVMYRALFESEHKGQVQAAAGMMVLSAMALSFMAMAGDDDEDEKWKNTPDYIKDSNMVFGFGDKQFTLTLPYGYRIFHTLGNVIAEYASGGDGHKLGIRLASSLFSNFSPLGNPMEGNVQGFSLLPTIPKMALGPSVNQDSFGREISPKKYSDNKPDSQTMYRGTKGTVYSGAARALNAITGGSDYQKGWADVSPETLKYWVNSLTGGAGKFAVDVVQSPYRASQGVDVPMKDIPIARRFVRDIGVGDSRSAFWERAKEAKEATDAFSAAKKAKDTEGVQKILEDKRDLLAMGSYAKSMQKMIKAKRDEIDSINSNKEMSLKQKDEQVKMIEIQETAIYTRFIRAFDERKKSKPASAEKE